MGIFTNENDKDLIRKENALLKRELTLQVGENVYTSRRSSETAIDTDKRAVTESNLETQNTLAQNKMTIAHEMALATKDKYFEEKEIELGSEKEKGKLKEEHVELIGKNVALSAEISSKAERLEYTKAHLNSILSQKDGIINGLEKSISMYKDQLEYMQRVLAVAVGKIPTVDFSTLKFNIEMPAPQNKSVDKGGNQPKN